MALEQITPGWATYLRVSDEDKQSPERSFAMQRQRIQTHLLEPSKEPIFREYTDLLSGTNPSRKDYQNMLADAEAGKFSHLGLYRADRFGRNTVEGLQSATKLISLGIKIRIANMPSLHPEDPDGFFMFLIQMGMAQREVDVLAQRTAGGMEAKMRAGGWPQRAPEGYLNKERQIGSNKYERWVEPDPTNKKALRLAWDLLLTGRYTLNQICEELASQGYVRLSGSPWAWNTPKTGQRKTGSNSLQRIFHNPFYAGWAVSKRFGIEMGEVRGNWEPIVTTEEFERGKEILLKNGYQKMNFKRKHYLLRGILSVQVGEKQYKLYGSTPSGKSQSYAYYITHTKIDGKPLRFSVDIVDQQIPTILADIGIDPELIPSIQATYQSEIKKNTQDGKADKLAHLQQRLKNLQDEEARLVRLFMTGKINEETYDRLRVEWKEKTRQVQMTVKELEFDASKYLDDLDVAIALLTKISVLFDRLKEKERTAILQVLIKQVIVNTAGEIIQIELHSPFSYLFTLVSQHKEGKSSSCISLGTPKWTRIYPFRQ